MSAMLALSAITNTKAIAATSADSAKQSRILTLSRLKNTDYQISDSACGSTKVRLIDGKGKADSIEVLFGTAKFGDLRNGRPGAVVHLAYKSELFGWLQEVVFMEVQGNKLVQVAEQGLDDNEQLKDIQINHGLVTLETVCADDKRQQHEKVIKIRLATTTGGGCTLRTTQWLQDLSTNELRQYVDQAPYLSTIEARIDRCWTPTAKDRSEHVVVSFKIKGSGLGT